MTNWQSKIDACINFTELEILYAELWQVRYTYPLTQLRAIQAIFSRKRAAFEVKLLADALTYLGVEQSKNNINLN